MFSISDYIFDHRIALGKSIKDRTKIYLDTNYWGFLCDASLKRDTDKVDEVYVEILDTIMQLVQENKIICPISKPMYMELLNIQGNKFDKTVEIMNLLSESIIIEPIKKCIDSEIEYYFGSINRDENLLYHPELLLWNKAIFLDTYLSDKLSFAENEFEEKKLFDELWNCSFSDFVYVQGKRTNEQIVQKRQRTQNLTDTTNTKNEPELKSEKQVFLRNIANVLEQYENIIEDTYNYIKNTYPELSKNLSDNFDDEINKIYFSFMEDKMNNYLPTFDVHAKVHTRKMWDKDTPFKNNDFSDIVHLTTALPYFDYYFTEKAFNTLARQIKYDEKYSCKVAYKKNEVLEILQNL
jgi:hypothetical protein